MKWGLAIDPELGSRVKVTVLATGFGLEDVEGMNRHLKKHTEEESRRIAEQEEKEQRTRKEERDIMEVTVQRLSTNVTHIFSCSSQKIWTMRM